MQTIDIIELELLRELEELKEKNERFSPRSNNGTVASLDCTEYDEVLDARDTSSSSSAQGITMTNLLHSLDVMTTNACGKALDGVEITGKLFCDIDGMRDAPGSDGSMISQEHDLGVDEVESRDDNSIFKEEDSWNALPSSQCSSSSYRIINIDAVHSELRPEQIIDTRWVPRDDVDEEGKNERCLLEESFMIIEREFKEQQSSRERSRKEIMCRREIMMSKERVECDRQGAAAYVLQLAARRFVSKIRAICAEEHRINLMIIVSITTEFVLKQYLLSWRRAVMQFSRARLIACWLRYHCQRRKVRLEALARMRAQAVVVINDIFYANRCKSCIRKLHGFAVIIQKQEKLAKERYSSSVMIQCLVRSHFSKMQVCKLREISQNISVLIIQCNWTGCLARKRYRVSKQRATEKKCCAAIAIQKIYRSAQTRRRFQRAVSSRYSHHDPELEDLLFDEEVTSMLNSILDTQDEDLNLPLKWEPQFPKVKGQKDKVALANNDALPEGKSGRNISQEHGKALGKYELMNEWRIKDERVFEVSIPTIF